MAAGGAGSGAEGRGRERRWAAGGSEGKREDVPMRCVGVFAASHPGPTEDATQDW